MDSAERPRVWNDARWLQVVGSDAQSFLQGYLTCDTGRDESCWPMAMCNLKGRVVANGWIVPRSDGAALIVHASLVATVRDYLRPYITFSKCALAAETGVIEIVDQTDGAALALLPDLQVALRSEPPDDAIDVSRQVNESLISARFALVSLPLSGQFLPQMLGLDQIGAVDFDKGCYLGQEIVARAQFRGAVKRRLVSFSWDGEPPAIGGASGAADVVVSVGQVSGLGVGASTG